MVLYVKPQIILLKKSFTLIELLIVVAIIGILAGVGIPAYQGYVLNAKVGKTVSDIEVIRIHYAKTISHWFKNFQNNRKKIKNLYDERFVRMWEVYLNLSELSFIGGDNVIFQLVLTKKKDAFPIVR